MTTATAPYLELFGCHLDTGDGCEHDGQCEWGWTCNICGRRLNDGPCPDHAPVEVPGLMLADCPADPPHPRTWLLANEGYGAPCMYCAYGLMEKAHAGCVKHRPWRRWKLTHRVLLDLHSLGVLRSHGVSWDGHGPGGCAAGIRWGRNGYLLGWPRWKWACVFRGRHWPGAEVADEVCGKCCPCPGCGSVTLEHRGGCPAGGEW